MKRFYIIILSLMVLMTTAGFTETVNLEQFLEKVEKNSKDLKLAKKDLDMADANKKEAWSLALPKIIAQGGYNRNFRINYLYIGQINEETGETATMKFQFNRNNDFSFSTVLNQTLFSFKVGNALKAAKQF